METQPILPFFFSALFLVLGEKKIPLISALILFATTLILILASVAQDIINSASFRMVQILVGPMFFLGAVAANAKPPSRSTLRVVTLMLLAFMILEVFAPSLYSKLASILLERANVADGHRGVSLLTPEPTYAVISITYLFFLTLWSRAYEDDNLPGIELLQIFLLLATMSTYAVFIITAFIAGKFPKTFIAMLCVAISTIPTLELAPLGNTENIRVVVALSRLLASDFSELLPTLSRLDASLGSRLLINVASFKTFFFAPLGLGAGCEALPIAFEKLGYIYAFENEVISHVLKEGCLKPQSYGATVFLGLGLGAFAFILVLGVCFQFSLSRLKQNHLWLPALTVAMMMLIVQSQLTNPIPWMLLLFAFCRPKYS